MTYTSAMRSVLFLGENIYEDIHTAGRAKRFCMLNVLVFGLLHALFAIHFSTALFPDNGQGLPAAVKIQIMVLGAGVAFLMHAGAALFLWVFSRGFGGRTHFLPVYMNLGISFVGLWPLAPALAALQAGVAGVLWQGFAVLAALYGLCVVYMGTKNASGLSAMRMSLAMVVAIIVVVSILSLWL